MNENNSIWGNFINKYNLSKTIRFELKPVGKTIDFIKENGLIEEDKQREKDFNEVKKIMDEYYVEFIENSLKNIKLDLSDLQEYYTIYFELKKDKYNSDLKKQFKNIQKKIANNMYQQIKDVDNF
jgi:CRISPR-associated protein Cpf1